MKNFKLDKQGFTLVEVIIAVGVLGALSLGIMRVMDGAQKGQKAVQGNIEFGNLRNTITTILTKKSLCSNALKAIDGTSKAKFKPSGTLSQSEKLGTILLGNSIIAQVGGLLNGGVKVVSMKLEDSGTSTTLTGATTTYLAKLTIEADVSNGPVLEGKKISNKKNPFFFSLTTNNATNEIVSCGGEDEALYPSSCNITLGHKDNHGPKRSVKLQLDSPGHVGLLLSGDVDNNDKIFISGNCDNNGPDLDRYMSTCNFEMGFADRTKNGNSNVVPSRFASTRMFAQIESFFQFTGNVNSDDSIYFRMRCPDTINTRLEEAQNYIRSNCFVCFGYSDAYRPQMDTRICSKVSNTTSTAWTRFRLTGDVNEDDILFPGFYCKNDGGGLVKSILWRNGLYSGGGGAPCSNCQNP